MSKPYPKINAPWKRTLQGEIIPNQFSTPEIEYLAQSNWVWTEKVDGTNIRLTWAPWGGSGIYDIQGRTNNAQIPPFLHERLEEICKTIPWIETFGSDEMDSVTLYGEGYGQKIQKVGSQYIPDGVDFVLFDILIEGPEQDWWLRRQDVEEVGAKLGIPVVQVVMEGTIGEAVWACAKETWKSAWPGVDLPEGLVGRPAVELFGRDGKRIMTKVKHKDITADNLEAILENL